MPEGIIGRFGILKKQGAEPGVSGLGIIPNIQKKLQEIRGR